MKTIKVVYQRETVLLDENNELITYDVLPEAIKDLFFDGMNGYRMQYYQELYDGYHSEEFKDEPYYQDPKEVYQEMRLVTACDIKALLPDVHVLFKNEKYNLDVNEEGFSEIPKDFDISTVILSHRPKELKIMFDYGCTGVWDAEGMSIPTQWLPVKQSTRELINVFQNGLNGMRIDYDNDYTEEENKLADSYMLKGLEGAIALKRELPDYTILFYNYEQYFDLPTTESCSEISPDLILDNIKVNK